ncbi:RNA polymerase sigma factor [Leadbetterella sp. DM7]|uniref:RNA polymerase sigma factor n=1 Tax=Leadbetterella sp. DM7 TaxID=3235085 RepID=UPI00349E9744
MQFVTTHEETTKLVELCRKGSSKAQYELYRLYAKAMYNTSLRIVGNREEAEDILQEAFLDGFMKIDFYRGDSTFGAWLKSIVVNKSIARLRSRRLQFEDLDMFLAEPIDEDNDDFEENEHTIQILKTLLNELSSGYRLVLSLYLFEGYDHKEISEILGISEVTSRSQFIRAKQRLLELYKTRK